MTPLLIIYLGRDDAGEVLAGLHEQVHVHACAVGAAQLGVGEQQLPGARLEGGQHQVAVIARLLRRAELIELETKVREAFTVSKKAPC